MVAIEISRLDPVSIISSPTNTRASVDHLIRNQFAVTVLECKGVDERDRIPIRMKQLWEYAFGQGPRTTMYVLPSGQGNEKPWQRRCQRTCCGGVGCRFCPRDARAWTGLDSWVRALAHDDRLQPWFSHWAWCIPCVDLAAHFGLSALTSPSGTDWLNWDDKKLSHMPNAVRLCHFFGVTPGSTGPSRSIVRAREQDLKFDSLEQFEVSGDTSESTPPMVILQPTPGRFDR
jgi:hypothetical protein